MSQCASQVKRVSLELGGLAPFVVFDSADLTKVGTGIVFSKYRNAGQTCISSQNFLLQEGMDIENTTPRLHKTQTCLNMKLLQIFICCAVDNKPTAFLPLKLNCYYSYSSVAYQLDLAELSSNTAEF